MKALLSILLLAATGVAVEAFGPTPRVQPTATSTTALAATAHHVVYTHTVGSIADLLRDTKKNLVKLEELAQKLQDLELRDPHVAEMLTNDALKASVAEAKAACDAYGPASPQAATAWTAVDAAMAAEQETSGQVLTHPSYRYSAAALRSHHAYNSIVDTKLLEDSIKAVETILALDHFVQVEKTRLDKERAK